MRARIGILSIVFCLGIPGKSVTAGEVRHTCLTAATLAEEKYDIPAGLLTAIGLRESRFDGQMWPWSLNIAGSARRYATSQDARKVVRRLQDAGQVGFDVGCFQIHFRWLGQSCVKSAEILLDPGLNAFCAAGYLKQLRQTTGSWTSAVEAYHVGPNRQDPSARRRARKYACLVGKTFATIRGVDAECDKEQK